MSEQLKQMGDDLARKRGELQAIFQQAETGERDPVTGSPLYNPEVMTKSMIEEVQRRNAELNQLEDAYQRARLADIQEKNLAEQQSLGKIERTFGAGGSRPPYGGGYNGGNTAQMKLSDRFVESPEYKLRSRNPRRYGMDMDDVDLKTLFSTAAGYAAPNDRSSKVVLYALRRPVISDLIPTDTTTNSVISWMEETTFTNNASTVSEGAQKPESALAYTERTQNVAKIATFLPTTEEQLDDVAQIRNLIDNRLTLMVLLAEESQLMYGSGSGADLQGFWTKSGTQTQAFDTNNADTVYKGMTKVRWTGYAEPSGHILHPDNWQAIRLMKTSGSGEYILGDPMSDVEARLWGKPVIVTPSINTGFGLTGDFVMFSHISRKLGLRIDVTDSHSDWFQYNKLAIRAEMRESLEIYRASAFCKLTGLA